MNSVIEKFEGVMMPLAGKISGNRYLLAMRDAFSMLLPFIIVTPGQVIGKAGDKIGAFGLDYFGNKAVLTAIIVATIASWIFVKLSKNEKIRIKMPETVPPAVANSFAVLVPVFVTLSVFTVFATILSVGSFMGKTALNDLIYALIQAPLMGFSQGLGFSILYQFIVWFFWWFGIHGHNVTAAIQNMVYMPAQLANQAGDASYVFSNGFFEELTLLQVMGLVLAIFIFSKKAAGALSLKSVSRPCSSISRSLSPLVCRLSSTRFSSSRTSFLQLPTRLSAGWPSRRALYQSLNTSYLGRCLRSSAASLVQVR